jgi:hypothetical protein
MVMAAVVLFMRLGEGGRSQRQRNGTSCEQQNRFLHQERLLS